jgi:hypothetical protein
MTSEKGRPSMNDRASRRGSRPPALLVAAVIAATGMAAALAVFLFTRDRGGKRTSLAGERADVAEARRKARSLWPDLPPAPPTDPTAPERAQAAVATALKTAPRTLSPTGAILPFDKEEFARNPKQYLAQVQPGRAFQTARPGRDAVVLAALVPSMAEIQRGTDATLWVRGVPNAPVTFTAFDGGAFKENGMPSVTVQADGRGLAVAHFRATPGLVGDLNIVAGSPLAVGVRRFRLRVVDHLAENQPAR